MVLVFGCGLHFLLLFTLIPFIAGRALSQRDGFTPAHALRKVDATLTEYLKLYEGPPNEDQLKDLFKNEEGSSAPAKLAPTKKEAKDYAVKIYSEFNDVLKAPNENPEHRAMDITDKKEFLCDRRIFKSMETDKGQFEVILSDLAKDGSGSIFIVATTRGFWILRLTEEFMANLVRDFQSEKKDKSKPSTWPIERSRAFERQLGDFFTPTEEPTSLRTFVKDVVEQNGKGIALSIVSKSDGPSDSPIHKGLRTSIIKAIQKEAKGYHYMRQGITAGSLEIREIRWNPRKTPWKDPESTPGNFKFSFAIFYSQLHSKWEVVNMLGPRLGLFALHAGSGDNDRDVKMPDAEENHDGYRVLKLPGAEEENHEADCNVESSNSEEKNPWEKPTKVSIDSFAPFVKKQSWSSIQTGDSGTMRFEDPLSDEKLGFGTILLTSEGYWGMFYTVKALKETRGQDGLPGLAYALQDLKKTMQNDFRGAKGLRKFVLAPTDQNEELEWTAQLQNALAAVGRETEDRFPSEERDQAYLIPVVLPDEFGGTEVQELDVSSGSDLDHLHGTVSIDIQITYAQKVWFKAEMPVEVEGVSELKPSVDHTTEERISNLICS